MGCVKGMCKGLYCKGCFKGLYSMCVSKGCFFLLMLKENLKGWFKGLCLHVG